MAVPCGVWSSKWRCGCVDSASPLSPMYAMNWPAFTVLPSWMPGARIHFFGFLPSSVPGVSLLMWMYQ